MIPPVKSKRRACCEGMRLLVVDDDRVAVDALKALLEMEGASVDAATNAAEAMQHLREQVPDVVVTDLSMPEQDGYALLNQILASPEHAHLPVIALTGFGREQDVQRVRDAGFHGHVCKPVVFEELLREITGAHRTTKPDVEPRQAILKHSSDLAG